MSDAATTGDRAVRGTWVVGVAAALAVSAALIALDARASTISPLILGLVVGMALGNTVGVPAVAAPGLGIAAKHLLRVGVVLLGLRISADQVVGLGAPALILIVGVVAVSFVVIRAVAARAGMTGHTPLLLAAGFSICGVSAVAATAAVLSARRDDTATAAAIVTACGTFAVFAIPALAAALALDSQVAGLWAGASIHDVGQVVAATSTAGVEGQEAGLVVKLGRVSLLGPVIAIVALGLQGEQRASLRTVRPPWFVVGFAAAIAVRSLDLVGVTVLDLAADAERLLMGAAMFAIGTAVRFRAFRELGLAPLATVVGTWLVLAAVVLAYVTSVDWPA